MTDKTFEWNKTSIDRYLELGDDERDVLEIFQANVEPATFVLEVDLG